LVYATPKHDRDSIQSNIEGETGIGRIGTYPLCNTPKYFMRCASFQIKVDQGYSIKFGLNVRLVLVIDNLMPLFIEIYLFKNRITTGILYYSLKTNSEINNNLNSINTFISDWFS